MKRLAVVADVGGTNTRLAWASRENGAIRLHDIEVFKTPSDLKPPIRDYLKRNLAGSPVSIALAVAGPIDGTGLQAHAVLTNHNLSISAAELAEVAGIEHAALYNDLEAVAQGLKALDSSNLTRIGEVGHAESKVSARVVIGVGTGVGVAAQLASGAVIAGEGGHIEAPFRGAVAEKRCADGAYSVEDFLSGPHLGALYAAVGHSRRAVQAAELVERARQQEPAAVDTLRWHADALGQFARDCVLVFGAWSGVYFTGGVISSIGEDLPADVFRRSFDIGRFRERLSSVPAFRITHPYPGLFGLAEAALRD